MVAFVRWVGAEQSGDDGGAILFPAELASFENPMTERAHRIARQRNLILKLRAGRQSTILAVE
jgi:hypothetical protein